jgi:hypothetical protein
MCSRLQVHDKEVAAEVSLAGELRMLIIYSAVFPCEAGGTRPTDRGAPSRVCEPEDDIYSLAACERNLSEKPGSFISTMFSARTPHRDLCFSTIVGPVPAAIVYPRGPATYNPNTASTVLATPLSPRDR